MSVAFASSPYRDGYWRTADGLSLHYRDYPGAGPNGDRCPPLLCLPGLTRNARDFAKLAAHWSAPAQGGWRVIAPEMRGRGLSEYAPDPATYTPRHYIADVIALLDALAIARVAIIGTSLGGLMAMLMALPPPMGAAERIAGALLNDIGPVLEEGGLAKIRTYVGRDQRFAGWPAAVAHLKAEFGAAFPGRGEAAWLASAQRMMVEDANGIVRYDYDPAIAIPFAADTTAPPFDLWPAFAALAGLGPLLIVRGGISDLLSAATFAAMQARAPGAIAAVAPATGHPPALDEPEVVPAISGWLAQIATAHR